jgi:hypothetical protein
MPWLLASAIGWTIAGWMTSGPVVALSLAAGGIALGLGLIWHSKRRRPDG